MSKYEQTLPFSNLPMHLTPLIGREREVALDLHKAALERVELLIEPLGALRRLSHGTSVVRSRSVCCRHTYTSFGGRNIVLMITTCDHHYMTEGSQAGDDSFPKHAGGSCHKDMHASLLIFLIVFHQSVLRV